ncbi:MAG: hypothetical protein CFE30_12925 [Bradyrhizobium sp. PARBB1]|nr:MAG: hypothetical protein CFE30_12925 [Bradyrhizobium sp. PARBB1]
MTLFRAALVGAMLTLAACATPPDITPLQASISNRQARLDPSLAKGNFGRAVAQAVTRSTTLGRSEAALRESEANLLAESGAYLPQVSIGLQPGSGIGFGVSTFAAVSQLVFDGGVGVARRSAAEARMLGHVAGRVDAGSRAALAAVQAWADVVTARRLVAAAESSLGALEETVARIAERSDAGVGTSSELLTAQSRLANERARVVGARSEAAKAEAVFAELFGHAAPADLSLPPSAPALPIAGAAGSPALQQAEAERVAAEADLAAVKSALFPALSMQTSVTDAGVRVGPGVEQSVSPSRGRAARVAAAEARVDARTVDLDATRRELESRLRILAAESAAARDRLAATQAAAEANRANLATARDQFDVGRRSLIELLDAEREALASEQQRIGAEHDRAMVGYAALAVTGDILDAFGITLPPRPGQTGGDRAK